MVESESHVLLNCLLYEDLQLHMYNQAFVKPASYSLSDEEKIINLFSSKDMVKSVTKTCKDILDRGRRVFYIDNVFFSF